jgi:hypothetical protein
LDKATVKYKKMKTISVKIKLKENSLDKVYDWKRELNKRKDEVLETLKNETVVFEAAFLDEISENEAYIIYVMQINDLEQSKKAVSESIAPIDAYHKNFKKETWGERKELETLIAFNV